MAKTIEPTDTSTIDDNGFSPSQFAGEPEPEGAFEAVADEAATDEGDSVVFLDADGNPLNMSDPDAVADFLVASQSREKALLRTVLSLEKRYGQAIRDAKAEWEVTRERTDRLYALATSMVTGRV